MNKRYIPQIGDTFSQDENYHVYVCCTKDKLTELIPDFHYSGSSLLGYRKDIYAPCGYSWNYFSENTTFTKINTDINGSMPQPGDIIHNHERGDYVCCTLEFLKETYGVGYNSKCNEFYGYRPDKSNPYGVIWDGFSPDNNVKFTQCFKNKPKDVVVYQQVSYDPIDKDFHVYGVDKDVHPLHNMKLTFDGGTGKLKSSEVIV